jgi:hypothetical protein
MTPGVEAAFRDVRNCDVVRYVDYWDGLSAKTDAQFFSRFLFAYCSVHTSWEGNISGYKAIKDHEAWKGSHKGLRDRLVVSGVGLHNNRARWIDQFSDCFWSDPGAFRRGPREAWNVYRDRLEGKILGLGPAKVSFALELAFPLEAEVLCLDVHMLRLYGVKDQSKLKVGQYERFEHDWVSRARAAELPSYIVKQVHWDALQGRPDSRYWSHVLEEPCSD